MIIKINFFRLKSMELDLQDVYLSTIGGPPDIDLMVNHLPTRILEAKNLVVPNVVRYRYKLASEINVGDVKVEIRTVNSRNL
jgi:hypothetical protein